MDNSLLEKKKRFNSFKTFPIGRIAEQSPRRAFVAIEQDSETGNRISIVAGKIGQFGLPMKYAEPENYHINLDFLGEVRERELAVQGKSGRGFPKALAISK